MATNRYSGNVESFLKLMADKNASDLFFCSGSPVHIKVEGILSPVGTKILTGAMVKEVAYGLMGEERIQAFQTELECNFAISALDERFRVNIYKQKGDYAIVIRYIKNKIPDIKTLGLPNFLHELVMRKRGLILVVGATGSGKSTTLAAMIDHRNASRKGHILTIEDPIEFTHHYKKSIIGQREVGIDTLSYENALKSAMRESPDVILVGEIRDATTMAQVMSFSKSGHLCLSTFHANNAVQTLDRIVSFFPPDIRRQMLMDLSLNLVAIVSQRLIMGSKGKRVPAIEVLQLTPYIRELIEKGQFDDIMSAMAESDEPGIMTFDKSLFDLYRMGRITKEEALSNVDTNSDLALKIRLSDDSSESDLEAFDI